MRRLVCATVMLLMLSNTAHAKDHGVKAISPDRLSLAGGELSLGLSQDWRQPLPQVERVLIVIHGRLRNAQTYLHSAEQAADQAGRTEKTLIIAPQFLNQSDVELHQLPDSVLRWKGNDWMAGDPSRTAQPLSSYAALDAILIRLGDKKLFPALKEIVIAGHSGGAQVVQRYAVLGHPALSPGLHLRYVIANPSSYAYFDETRPAPGFEPSACPGFNHWKYGLQDLPAYADSSSAAQREQTYVKRDITYLLGQQDTNPNHPALDKSCEAQAQGAYRLIRGHQYFDYLRQRHPEGMAQRLIEVPGVGHDGDKMFTSPEGQAALFNPVQ